MIQSIMLTLGLNLTHMKLRTLFFISAVIITLGVVFITGLEPRIWVGIALVAVGLLVLVVGLNMRKKEDPDES